MNQSATCIFINLMMFPKTVQKFYLFPLAAVVCVTSITTTIRFDGDLSQLKLEVGEPAYAGRNRAAGEVLEFVLGNVIQAGTSWALDRAANEFMPQQEAVAPSSQNLSTSNFTYVGSSFVGSTYYNGQQIQLNYFANNQGVWYGWYPLSLEWRQTSPSILVYRTADIFMNSSGQLVSLPPT